MGTMGVVVLEILPKDGLEVAAANDQDPVKAFPADCSHEPLGERVALGALTGVRMARKPSVRNTSSNVPLNLASRSRMRSRRLDSAAPIAMTSASTRK